MYDNDDNELSSRERDLLNFPPSRFYDPRDGPYSDWKARTQEYGMLQRKLNEERREREIDMMIKMKNLLKRDFNDD